MYRVSILMLWLAVLFSFFPFNEISVTFPKKEKKQKCVEWVVGVGRVINRRDV